MNLNNTTTAQTEKHSFSTYAFLRLDGNADFQKVYKDLYFQDCVQYCDAVREEYDIVLLLNACMEKDIQNFVDGKLKTMDEITEIDYMPIRIHEGVHSPSKEEKEVLRQSSVSAYVFLEIEKEKLDRICSQLYLMDGVVSCDVTSGRYGMVLLVNGTDFPCLDELIQDKIWQIDGVIRARKVNIIEMFEMGMESPDERIGKINYELWKYDKKPGQLIPLLQKAQEDAGYVSEKAIRYISGVTRIPESQIYGVVTFYKQFRLKPVGEYLIRLCDGTACHVNNSKMLKDIIEDELQFEGGDTSDDGLFTLELVACLGCCSLAPVITINDQTYGRLTPLKLRKILKQYKPKGKQK
ncbi:MAG: NADH-quinone oxidoreductase subunit NuoE [Bacteriovoracaceae bacterium]|nr:NADH-quinone oxidoreductase subunit NuoE [Bacteriovoracaceae bacterium]